MQVREVFKRLWQSKDFNKWEAQNKAQNKDKDFFLAHAFIMPDADLKGEWQIGYYNSKDDMMTSFFLNCSDSKTILTISPETEVFKKEQQTIRQLDIDALKVDYSEAMAAATNFSESEYPKDKALKRVVILQSLKLGQVWNITFITSAFNTINIKVDSETGAILSHEKTSLLDYKAKESS